MTPCTAGTNDRVDELRDLWIAWDPLNVFGMDPDWARDEYDSYLASTLALLETLPAGVDGWRRMTEHLDSTLVRWFAMDEDDLSRTWTAHFAQVLVNWYASRSSASPSQASEPLQAYINRVIKARMLRRPAYDVCCEFIVD